MALKKYDTLPVIVVEDHNEALPHVYRSIGSKYLPMSGLTLLHLDSHPDMLVPVTMPADLVYNKNQLFESLSIENWILPAVYAGHISHIVWIKPPWCGQIQDKVTEFYVGKCKKNGTIRTTCTESYFLSETLYVPEHQLENKKTLKFTSITLCPREWETDTNTSAQEGAENSMKKHETIDNTDCAKEETECDQSNNTDIESKRCVEADNHVTANPNKKMKTEDDSNGAGADNVKGKTDMDKVAEKFTSPSVSVLRGLEKDLESRSYVLDIDLDFFSTMNPFKDMYGEKQYSILQELYKFTRPQGEDEKDLAECVKQREKQLADMKNIFSQLEKDSQAEIEHDRSDLIRSLVSDLQTQRPGSVDFELLHEAGCTCDDTELPHHVSTCAQVSLLVDAVQEFLSYLKKPTFITVARSSSDDYCPPNQVDMIQESVLDLLQQLYLKVTVTMDYQTDDDAS